MPRFTFFVLALLATALIACSDDDDSPPRFRVRNERSTDASLQVKTSGGNTININNVKPGVTSAYQDVAPGQVDITVSIQGDPGGPYVAIFVAVANQSFTIVVANTTPPTVAVVSP